MTSENERMFREKLSILNENFLRFLQKSYRSNDSADFTPSLKDYMKHLSALDKMYYLGDQLPEAPTAPVVTTCSTTTNTSSAPSTILINGVGAPAVTASSGSSGGISFGCPSTTTTPLTTTTLSTNFAPLFGLNATQPKTTTTTAVPSFAFNTRLFPTSASLTGSLFGGSTQNSLTASSALGDQTDKEATDKGGGSDDVSAEDFVPTDIPAVPLPPKFDAKSLNAQSTGSRKRSAAQSVDEVSPYGKRSAPSSTTESNAVLNLFGTSTTNPTNATTTSTTSPNSASIFSSSTTTTSSYTTVTSSTNLPSSFFDIAAPPKMTTSTTAANPTFPSFKFGTGISSTTIGSLFGSSQYTAISSIAPSLFASSTTTTASATEPSPFPKFPFSFGASTATVSSGSSGGFNFGGLTTTTTSVTTTTLSTNILPLFGLNTTQPKTTTTTAVPPFAFGTRLFPTSASSTGSLFGGSTKNAVPAFPVVADQTDKAATDKGGGSDDEAVEEFVPSGNFVPAVPLPPKVDVKSGEENEEVLFNARCKLFRFDSKEKQNKERGLGELKLLHNKETSRYRCVIRTDGQLSKLCANFPVLATTKSQATHQKLHFRTLPCKDFSDSSEGVDEVFLFKFRDQNTAEDFAAKLEETAKKLEEGQKGTD